MFHEAAAAFADFLFRTLHVRRLEARPSPSDGRAVAALRTLGAEAEALLRKLCDDDGRRWGRVLWTIHRDGWLSRVLKPVYASEQTARTPHTIGSGDTSPAPDWCRRVLPMQGPGCLVRELTLQDAPRLSALLAAPGVSRFLSPPPDGVTGFERFIAWTHRQRALGQSLALGIVPAREERAVGILQLHSLHPRFDFAEWGFAIGEPYWGTGLFPAAARLLLTFAFETVRVRRLEARAWVENPRATGALRKLGAVPEGRLRRHDSADPDRDATLWSVLDDEWLTSNLGSAMKKGA